MLNIVLYQPEIAANCGNIVRTCASIGATLHLIHPLGFSLDEKAFQRAWNKLKREMNIAMGCAVYRNELVPPYPLAEDLVPYCLRHTFCTNLQKKSVDIRTAQYLMGHSDIRMTANIYTHIMVKTKIESANRYADVLKI